MFHFMSKPYYGAFGVFSCLNVRFIRWPLQERQVGCEEIPILAGFVVSNVGFLGQLSHVLAPLLVFVRVGAFTAPVVEIFQLLL